jgi:hypothetical protein
MYVQMTANMMVASVVLAEGAAFFVLGGPGGLLAFAVATVYYSSRNVRWNRGKETEENNR